MLVHAVDPWRVLGEQDPAGHGRAQLRGPCRRQQLAFLHRVWLGGAKPQGLTARNRVAALYAMEHKNDAALKLVQEVLAENPRDNDALLLRGNLAMQGDDPAAAIGDLRAVLRDQPDAVPVLRWLAHIANHEPALAEETLQRAVALTPADPDVRVELTQLLVQTGKSEQALPLIEQTVRDNPTHVQAREMLMRLYLARADYPAARVARRPQDARPTRPWALSRRHRGGRRSAPPMPRRLMKALQLQRCRGCPGCAGPAARHFRPSRTRPHRGRAGPRGATTSRRAICWANCSGP
jgi:Flp pilus assembly protein TadD